MCGQRRCITSSMPLDSSTHQPQPGFQALSFDPVQCRTDLDAFEYLLLNKAELSERDDILPFFRAHPHLSLLLGSYNPNILTYDRVAFELTLSGTFTADVVVGDWDRKRYCFVEFEDGKSNSIFVRRTRQTTDWSSRFDHGFSQIVDWLWMLEATKNTEPFERQFGKRAINATMLLVIGRDSGVTDADRLRLEWRRDHVVVDSRLVYCCTFDELLRDLRQRLDRYGQIAHP